MTIIDRINTAYAHSEITDFHRCVYLELLRVPRGETITYGELVRRIGCCSAQAVG